MFLLFCLRHPPLTSAAANSLQLICSSCSDKMAQHFNVLAMHTIEALKSTISTEAALSLLKSTSMVMSKIPANEIYSAMKSLCYVQIEPLSKLNEVINLIIFLSEVYKIKFIVPKMQNNYFLVRCK